MKPRRAPPLPKRLWLPLLGTSVSDVHTVGRYEIQHSSLVMTPHTHGPRHLEISYLAKGAQTYLVNGRPCTLHAQDVLVILPNQKHGSRGGRQTKGLLYFVTLRLPESEDAFLDLKGDQARKLRAALEHIHPQHFHGSPEMKLHLDALMQPAIEVWRPIRGTNPLADLRFHVHLVAFLLDVVECAARPAQPPSLSLWADLMVSHIRSRIAEPLPIRELAAVAGLSVSHFVTRFRKEMGITPADYVGQQKIAIAKQRLIAGKSSVTEIAFDLGFSSSQYFAAVFKRYTGKTPSDFLRRR